MKDDGSLDWSTCGRLEPASLVLVKLTVPDELRENVLQLPSCGRSRIELHQELVQICTSAFRLLYRPQNIFFLDWLLFPFSSATHFVQSIGLAG